ncbi:MAG: phosphate acyltransferase PlsX [Chloroflexi bacterium]|nr:phosphate acyltransferase PlsX [Chloroflexota bacterium]
MTARIALDGMGGDHAPGEIVRGAAAAVEEFGVELILVGTRDLLERELSAFPTAARHIEIVPAPEVIGMDDSPLSIRRKSNSTIAVGLRLVKDGGAGAFVSAGNTGAVLLWANSVLGALPGVERPALSTALPTATGMMLVLDVGANPNCLPEDLVRFAQMGSIYSERAYGVTNPRVGLLSNGEEDTKGNLLVKEANHLLRGAGVNFIGNVEGKDMTRGAADVVVCDGFTGNIVIKVAEGVSELLLTMIRDELTSRVHYKLAAAVLRPAFRAVAKRLDYAEYGAAPLLGVRGLVLVAHGRSNARAIRSAIKAALEASNSGVAEALAALRPGGE